MKKHYFKNRLWLLFFVLSAGQIVLADELEIQNNYCFGSTQHILLEGRVLEKRDVVPITGETDSALKNIWYSVLQFLNEEEENEPVNLQFDDRLYQTRTDEEGFFLFDLSLTSPLPAGYQPVELFLARGKASTLCQLRVFGEHRETAIISDFDDTVIVSEVGDKPQLLANLLTKNFMQREAVAGMVELYDSGLTSPGSPLFFVTGSPRQMQKSIESFLEFHHFPKSIIITKKLEGKGSDPLFDQLSYKIQKIEMLFNLLPDLDFVLIGDDGEKDPEVYQYFQSHFSERVKSVWIRTLSQDKDRMKYPDQRYFNDACDIKNNTRCTKDIFVIED